MTIDKIQGYTKLAAGLLLFKGEKAAAMLHGQLTNDIKNLKVGAGNLNLLLNQKGKVRATLHVLNTGESLWILCESKSIEMLLDHFSRMAPLSRVEITDLTESFVCQHVFISSSLIEIFPLLSSLEKGQIQWVNFENEKISFYRSDRLGQPGVDVIVPRSIADVFLESLKKIGLEKLTEVTVEQLRIMNGIPKSDVDYAEENLPQECLLDAALHFNKGCYLGQEIIARLHFKGHVNKLLKRLKITGTQAPAAGNKLMFEGKEVGWITSVTKNTEGIFALGYVPYKMSSDGVSFEMQQGGTATLFGL